MNSGCLLVSWWRRRDLDSHYRSEIHLKTIYCRVRRDKTYTYVSSSLRHSDDGLSMLVRQRSHSLILLLRVLIGIDCRMNQRLTLLEQVATRIAEYDDDISFSFAIPRNWLIDWNEWRISLACGQQKWPIEYMTNKSQYRMQLKWWDSYLEEETSNIYIITSYEYVYVLQKCTLSFLAS